MIVIDTNVIVAYHNARDALHERAVALMQRIDSGEYGEACIPDCVFDETMNYFSVKVGRKDAIEVGSVLQESFHISRTTDSVFRGAWVLFKATKGLSFTDCVNVAMAIELECRHIATFDKGFKQAKLNIIDS